MFYLMSIQKYSSKICRTTQWFVGHFSNTNTSDQRQKNTYKLMMRQDPCRLRYPSRNHTTITYISHKLQTQLPHQDRSNCKQYIQS